jgi:hypothetical protein
MPNPAAAQPRIPEGWEIVEIFPAGTEYYCGPPDINERGQIVFHRRLWPSLSEIEIMLYERGGIRPLTDDDVYDSFPRINNHGHIVWARDLAGDGQDTGIVLLRNKTWEVVSDEPHGENTPDINDAGHIVWWAALGPTNDIDEIFFFDGTATRRITNDTFSDQSPRINGAGDLVFTQYNFGAGAWASQIIAYFNRMLRRLSSGQGQLQLPDLNDHRQVVWQRASMGIQIWDGGTVRQLVPENAYGARINNRQQICFSRWDAAEENLALWLIDNGELMQLTDAAFGGGASAINDRGDIAFMSGRVPATGIALFTKRCFRGDFDSDGDRDLQDFAILQRNFGSQNVAEELCPLGDMTADGCIRMEDYEEFALWFMGISP